MRTTVRIYPWLLQLPPISIQLEITPSLLGYQHKRRGLPAQNMRQKRRFNQSQMKYTLRCMSVCADGARRVKSGEPATIAGSSSSSIRFGAPLLAMASATARSSTSLSAASLASLATVARASSRAALRLAAAWSPSNTAELNDAPLLRLVAEGVVVDDDVISGKGWPLTAATTTRNLWICFLLSPTSSLRAKSVTSNGSRQSATCRAIKGREEI